MEPLPPPYEFLASYPWFAQLLAAPPRVFPPKEAETSPLPPYLHPSLVEVLQRAKINELYTHQTAAYRAWKEGLDVAIVTGTASGKTWCYNLPALESCLSEPVARCLYLFPTKALAQDQLGKLNDATENLPIYCATYDGDTPKSKRSAIRTSSHIILTNPDMLHLGILPQHETWGKFLRNLRLIVLDEMHSYRGVFGSHVALVLRRLLRLCAWYGSKPQIIGCSATIANAQEHFQNLTGRKPKTIEFSGAPRGPRYYFLMANDEAVAMPDSKATASIVTALSEHTLSSLSFCRSRAAVETTLVQTRRLFQGSFLKPDMVESYRGGYTAKERRDIEQQVFRGKLRALVSTNAMELGVDIGGLDAVVMNGVPSSIASFWQQAGRAGRGSNTGATFVLAGGDALEQYLVHHPDLIFQTPVERVTIHTGNPIILSQQLRCMAYERPIEPTELESLNVEAVDAAAGMQDEGTLQFRAGRYFYPSHEAPAPTVNIRTADSKTVTIKLDDQPLGTMEYWRALQHAHKGAIYLHRGESYEIQSLNLEALEATCTSTPQNFYTQPVVSSLVTAEARIAGYKWGPYDLTYAVLGVTQKVLGYRKVVFGEAAGMAFDELDLPASEFQSVGLQLDLPLELLTQSEDFVGALHGLEHALMAVAPLFSGCERNDLSSAWMPVYPETMAPVLFVYDAIPGGLGLTERLLGSLPDWTFEALRLVESCDCETGCPRCLYSSRCEARNEALSKPGAIKLLRELHGTSI